jgi:hypothetical protein
MSDLIKLFSDGSTLEYDRGSFDDWCVYLTRPGKQRFPPLDVHYFAVAVQLGNKYTNEAVYSDFIQIYSLVRQEKLISTNGHKLVDALCDQYEDSDVIRFQILYTILYAAMVAEERKAYTKLGAKIKRLGIHQILMDSPPLNIEDAASFSRGKGWRAIDSECAKRGF